MMPLAAKIGQDAADIAFTALGEVAKGFSLDQGATDAKLAQARADLDRSLARSISATHFNGAELGKGIGDAVAGVVPRLMGDIVGGALRAALSGDRSRLERLDDLHAPLEAPVAPPAKPLERTAQPPSRRRQALT